MKGDTCVLLGVKWLIEKRGYFMTFVAPGNKGSLCYQDSMQHLFPGGAWVWWGGGPANHNEIPFFEVHQKATCVPTISKLPGEKGNKFSLEGYCKIFPLKTAKIFNKSNKKRSQRIYCKSIRILT